MSKPPTQAPIAAPSSQGSSAPIGPVAASQPPTGATAIASARKSCVYVVYRLASEYQNTIPSATGDSARQTRPSWEAAATNTTDETMTKTVASVAVIAPRGSSRIAVRGFFASHRASTSRLNPIAALRAATIATMTQTARRTISGLVVAVRCTASSAPVSANGSANTLWLKRTNERYVRSRVTVAALRLNPGVQHTASFFSSGVEPSNGRGLNAGQQVFFHIPHGRRQLDGEELRALAGLDRTQLRREAKRTRAGQRRAPQDPRRRDPRRQPPHRRHLGEQVQILDARQAIGAARDRDARRLEPGDGRLPGAGPAVAARTGDSGRPGGGKP